jgi:hypothetical protein
MYVPQLLLLNMLAHNTAADEWKSTDGGWMGWCPMSLSLTRKMGDVPAV